MATQGNLSLGALCVCAVSLFPRRAAENGIGVFIGIQYGFSVLSSIR
jgi:hypothetical protein